MSLLEIKAVALLALLAGLVIAVGLWFRQHDAAVTAACVASQQAAAVAFNKQSAAQDAAASARVASAVQERNDALLTVAVAGGALSSTIDRVRQRAAADSLRNQVSCAASAPAGGASAPGASLLQSDVPGWLASVAGFFADEADRRGVAGATCQRSR